MAALLTFGVVLLAAVLVSAYAHRSILSTAVLFLVAGFAAGQGVLGIVSLQGDNHLVTIVAEVALFSVLFTDGMRSGIREITSAWRLPGRALLFGLPLTMLGTAALARFIVGLPWADSLLLGAVLAPTDPVFAAAIVGREEVPGRLRHLLNVESGVNDGLALPFVLVFLSVAGPEPLDVGLIAAELALGVVIGVAIPWVAARLEASRWFSASSAYEPLNAFAVGIIVFAAAELIHANLFLAAFAAGITVATTAPSLRDSFHSFGETVTELAKLLGLFVFGAVISPQFLGEVPISGYVFALLTFVAVRPVAIGIALLRSEIAAREWVAAAWFGPKGFASVVYGLLLLDRNLQRADQLFHLVAIAVAGSILAHSSTDVLVARWFREREHEGETDPSATSPTARS